MAIMKSNLMTEIFKGIGKKILGHSAGERATIDFQIKQGRVIARKKSIPTRKVSEKQRAWREKFCNADNLYRQLTARQKERFYEYTQYYNRKNKTNLSPHSLFMKLFLEGKLDEFLEKWLGWKWGEIHESEYETHVCWMIYITSKEYEGLKELVAADTAAVRR